MSRVDVAKSILGTLRARRAPPVYGFINARQLEAHPADDEVLRLWREAGFPLGNHTFSHMADPERNLVPEIGILGVEIDARIAAAASGLRAPYGVIVAARASGALVDVPLQANDVIRSVNDRKVATLAQLREVLRALPPGAPVTLQVQREGRLTYVSFTFD